MTRQELCKKYDLTEATVLKNFKRAQETMRKKYGVELIKTGRGDNVNYEVTIGEAIKDMKQAIEFIEKAHQDILMDRTLFTDLIDWNFMVFMGIILCPMHVFRGTYEDFLHYVGIKNINDTNITQLKSVITQLCDKGIIYCNIDTSSINRTVITMNIISKVEDELCIGIDMIKRCMRLQQENRMNSWVPLLKTWIGLQILVLEKDPFSHEAAKPHEHGYNIITFKELEAVTGMNRKMLTKCRNILEQDNLFQMSKAYENRHCIGQRIDLNGIEHDYSNVM